MRGRAMLAVLGAVLGSVLIWSPPGRGGEPEGAPAAAPGKPELRSYDVRGLCATVDDYPGPVQLFPNQGDMGGDIGYLRTDPFPPAVTTPRVTAESTIDMIRQRFQPESWQPGKGHSIENRAWQLAVIHTPEVHRLIAAQLQAMEDRRLRLSVQGLVVSVEARAARELRMRPSPSLSAQEVEALIKAAGPGGVLAAPEVVCAHGQRNNAAAVRFHRRVSAYRAGDGAIQPVLSSDVTGMTFDVRPVMGTDGSSADLDVHFNLTGNWREREVEFSTLSVPRADQRPIRPGDEGSTGGEAHGHGKPVPFRGRITLPEAGCWRLHTRVTVPLDTHILVGMGPAAPGLEGKAGAPDRTVAVIARVRLLSGKPGAESWSAAGRTGQNLVQAFYDTADLSWPKPDWPAPRLGPSYAQQAANVDFAPIMTVGPPGGGDLPPGAMQDMIKRAIEPASWGVGGTSIQEQNGQVIVFHTPAVQERIARFIVEQRAVYKKRLLVQGLVLELGEEAAARLAADGRREFTPEEAEELVAAAGPKGLLAAPRIVACNLQRVHVAGTLAATYVNGFSASGAAVLPEARLVQTGWAFEVRPILSAERRSAEMEVRFKLAEKLGEKTAEEKSPLFRCRYQAPEIGVLDVRATPSVPLGKYSLVGIYERRAEPPGGRGKGASKVAVLAKVDLVELPKAKEEAAK